MNAVGLNTARKLIACVAEVAARINATLHHPELTTGDIMIARGTIAAVRADLDECDQALRIELESRVRRKDPLTPRIACTHAEVDRYEAKLHAATACVVPATIHETAGAFAGVESPARAVAARPRRAPDRYTWDHHARQLIAAGGTLQFTKRPA